MKKVLVLKRAYYNDMLLKPNDIVIFKEDIIPSWAKVLDEKNTKCQSKKTYSKKHKKLFNIPEKDTVKVLENLKTLALDRGIIVDLENKSILEQINELEKFLKLED